jgi:hypothetical protein
MANGEDAMDDLAVPSQCMVSEILRLEKDSRGITHSSLVLLDGEQETVSGSLF